MQCLSNSYQLGLIPEIPQKIAMQPLGPEDILRLQPTEET
jgi:hypothetical protein